MVPLFSLSKQLRYCEFYILLRNQNEDQDELQVMEKPQPESEMHEWLTCHKKEQKTKHSYPKN